jgi:hypothetical protein
MSDYDSGATDVAPPQPPGDSPPGEEGLQTTLIEDAPGERIDIAAPALPAAWQPLADWCNQQPPSFAGSANTIHFYLNHTDGIGYQGCMFFKPATPPFHYFSRNRFYGTGHVYPNVPWGELYKVQGPSHLPAPWVKLVIGLRATDALAGLTFHEASGSGALPGSQVAWGEEDVRELLGSSPHFVTSLGPWVLYLELTTLLLG